jgi:uncharacterized protein (UPF0335 family)
VARKAKTETEGHGVSAVRGNGFDPDAVTGFVERIEDRYAELNKIASKRMEESKSVRVDIDEIYKEAKNAGIPKKALKQVIKKRGLLADIEECGTNLEGDDETAFEQLQSSLGMLRDTPLGKSALARKARNGSEGVRA